MERLSPGRTPNPSYSLGLGTESRLPSDTAYESRSDPPQSARYPNVENGTCAHIPDPVQTAILNAALTDREHVDLGNALPGPTVQAPFELLGVRKRRREVDNVYRVLDL